VLIIIVSCAYYSSMGHDIMLNHSRFVSQGYSRVGCPDDGLRILARLIVRDLATKRQDNTSKKNDRKVGAHKHWRVAGEGLS
jgi:hypothetical protein